MTQTPENRKYERVAVTIPAKFSVLIPEHTFSPIDHECEVMDLSERGAMLIVKMLPENYSSMLQKTRYCRLQFPESAKLPERITGKAVWLQPQGKDDARQYRIGLFFEDCPEEIVSALREYVKTLSKPAGPTSE